MDQGRTLTMVRFNPQGTKLLAARATMTKEVGYDDVGCVTGFLARVPDVKKFFNVQCNYGHHMVWAYGDWTQELEELGSALGLEVETL
jgi:hypothetical protein